MLERRARRVAVRIAGRHIEVVERAALLDEVRRRADGQLLQQPCDDVAPTVLTVVEMDGFGGFLGGLVSREAGPLVAAVAAGRDGLLEISLGLGEPVTCAVRHDVSSGRVAIVARPRMRSERADPSAASV